MKELIIAVGLLFVLEGLLYSIFPAQMKKMMLQMQNISESNLRTGGLFFALLGFIIVWIIKG
ncbi:MAG: ubiquitin-binding protein [Candidatus Pelagibacter sp.]|nr:ubiquitin-binding protein [Candidatus Pelagibacter sp.]|tara:strand:- start:114 stop:299 length:186 start_codon:yes stop_codon:yes gene_type:complete